MQLYYKSLYNHNESDDKQEVDKVLDDLIAQLDKQIEELEAEEKATDNKSSANQKDVTVFVTGLSLGNVMDPVTTASISSLPTNPTTS